VREHPSRKLARTKDGIWGGDIEKETMLLLLNLFATFMLLIAHFFLHRFNKFINGHSQDWRLLRRR